MHDAETRSLRRAFVLLALVSGVRWAWMGSGGDGPDHATVLPELTEAVAEATSEASERARPLGPDERIDPNRADEAALDRLPGVGPAIAAAIVDARAGGAVFRRAEDLQAVRGIGPAMVARVSPFLEITSPPSANRSRSRPRAAGSARPAAVTTVDINRASAEALTALPGIGPAIAQRIVEHRRNEPFRSVDDLLDVKGVGPRTLERLRARVSVRGGR